MNILDLANQHTQMKPSGKHHWGCCPIHGEKTASFRIDENEKFRCYGCGAFGDVIDLYQAIYSCNFETAKRALGLWTEQRGPKRSAKPKRSVLPTEFKSDDKRECYVEARKAVINYRDLKIIYHGKTYQNYQFIGHCLRSVADHETELLKIRGQVLKTVDGLYRADHIHGLIIDVITDTGKAHVARDNTRNI